MLYSAILGSNARIYATTFGGGIKVFRDKDSGMSTSRIISGPNAFVSAIAIDTRRSKLYGARFTQVHRSEMDGTAKETLLDTNECKLK